MNRPLLTLIEQYILDGKIPTQHINESMKMRSVPLIKPKKKSRKHYVAHNTFDVNSLGTGMKATEDKIVKMMLGKKVK